MSYFIFNLIKIQQKSVNHTPKFNENLAKYKQITELHGIDLKKTNECLCCIIIY